MTTAHCAAAWLRRLYIYIYMQTLPQYCRTPNRRDAVFTERRGEGERRGRGREAIVQYCNTATLQQHQCNRAEAPAILFSRATPHRVAQTTPHNTRGRTDTQSTINSENDRRATDDRRRNGGSHSGRGLEATGRGRGRVLRPCLGLCTWGRGCAGARRPLFRGTPGCPWNSARGAQRNALGASGQGVQPRRLGNGAVQVM